MCAAMKRPRPAGQLLKGAAAGVGAGIVFLVLNMWYAASTGGPAAMPLHAISTVVLGDSAMAEGSTNPVVGAIVHVVLSAGFGVGLALVVMRLRSNAAITVTSTVYGGLLFVVNFLVLAPLVFSTFQMPNKPFELVVHLVFGTSAGFAFLLPEARTGRDSAASGAEHRRTA